MSIASSSKPKTRFFNPFSALGVTLFAFFASQLVVGILIGIFLQLKGGNIDQAYKDVSDSTLGQFVFIFLVEAATLGILYLFMRWMRLRPANIGLGRKPRWSDLGYALPAFVIYFIVLIMVLGLVGQFLPGVNLDQEQQVGFDHATGTGSLVIVFFCLVILPPIAEEILVRGFLYSGLRRKLRPLVAALIASVVFGSAHLQLGSGAPPLYVAAIDTFVLSMVLIGLRERTSSLWAGMVVHAIKNALAFSVLFIFHG